MACLQKIWKKQKQKKTIIEYKNNKCTKNLVNVDDLEVGNVGYSTGKSNNSKVCLLFLKLNI